MAEEKEELEKRKLEEKKLIEDVELSRGRLKSKTEALEAEVNKSCQQCIEDKQKVQAEIAAIDEEIRELERKIEERRTVRKGKEDEEQRIKAEIQKVKSTFHDQEQEIATIDGEIAEGEEKRKKASEWIAAKDEGIQTSSKKNQEKFDKRGTVLAGAMAANKDVHGRADQRKQQIQEKETARDRYEEQYKEWYNLKLKASNLEKKQEYYEEKAGKSDGQIGELTIELTNTKAALGKMEEEKKAFAAARKFKDAAKAASDIKAVQATFEKTQKSLAELTQERDAWMKEIAEIVKDVAKFRGEEQQAEERLNKTKYRQLQLKSTELESLLGRAEEVKSEREATEVLRQQIKLCQEEQATMRKKWGYLEECDYECMSPDDMLSKWRQLKDELSRTEKEIEVLSSKEDYEGAEKKQNLMKETEERARILEAALKRRGKDVNEKVPVLQPSVEPTPAPTSVPEPAAETKKTETAAVQSKAPEPNVAAAEEKKEATNVPEQKPEEEEKKASEPEVKAEEKTSSSAPEQKAAETEGKAPEPEVKTEPVTEKKQEGEAPPAEQTM